MTLIKQFLNMKANLNQFLKNKNSKYEMLKC